MAIMDSCAPITLDDRRGPGVGMSIMGDDTLSVSITCPTPAGRSFIRHNFPATKTASATQPLRAFPSCPNVAGSS